MFSCPARQHKVQLQTCSHAGRVMHRSQAPGYDGTVGRLPSDLWVSVFAALQRPADGFALDQAERHARQAESSAYFRLRLVCKAFDQVFRQHHPQLTRSVTLCEHLREQHIPSLLGWLHGCLGLLRLEAFCASEFLETALVKLSFATNLEVAYLEAVRPQTINLLPIFGCLRSCHLEPAVRQLEMDLSALQQLCSLESLGLIRGWFTAMPIASSLTALYIDRSRVTAAEGNT